jgi:hypothetical protein
VATLDRRDGGGRRVPNATGLDTLTITAANGPTIIADPTNGVVVTLDAWRWRPWSGWWGTSHLATWSFAERSGRIA